MVVINVRGVKRFIQLVEQRLSRSFNSKHSVNLLNVITDCSARVNVFQRKYLHEIRPGRIQHPRLLLSKRVVLFGNHVHNLAGQHIPHPFDSPQNNILHQRILKRFQLVNFIRLVQRLRLLVLLLKIQPDSKDQIVAVVIRINARHLALVILRINRFNRKMHIIHRNPLLVHGLAVHLHSQNPLGPLSLAFRLVFSTNILQHFLKLRVLRQKPTVCRNFRLARRIARVKTYLNTFYNVLQSRQLYRGYQIGGRILV